MARLQRFAAAFRSLSPSPSVSRRALMPHSPPAPGIPSEIYRACSSAPATELRAGEGGSSGASAHGRLAVPRDLHPSATSAPTAELRAGGGEPSGDPVHRWIAELLRARASAPTTFFRPVGGEPSGLQVLTKVLTKEQLKRPHAARLSEVLRAPAISTGWIQYENSCSGGNHAKSCALQGSSSGVNMGSLTCPQHSLLSKHNCSGSNLATRVCRRRLSSGRVPPPLSSAPGPVPPPLSTPGPVPPPLSSTPGPVPPPPDWDGPFFDETPLSRSGPPGFLEPDLTRSLKTLRPVVPLVCIDESTYLANYEPLDFIESMPLVRNKVIYGVQPDASGVQPSVLLPADKGLRLMRSLPLLARFFHEQHCCLPRITLEDLVTSGDGQFRLRGCDVVPREFTLENVCDVYTNIDQLLRKMLASYGFPGDYLHLNYQLEHYGASDTSEYLICFNAFFIPLGNKGSALFRFIDYLLELPKDSDFLMEVLGCLPYTDRTATGRSEWVDLALGNCYLRQWMQFRQYGDGRLEFLRFVRAVLCHKLRYGLSDKFVDFLVYATYPRLLSTLQYKLCNGQKLMKFQLEELFPKDLTSNFPELQF